MPDIETILVARRPELIVRPLGDRGEYVVKDSDTGAYFHLGPEEAFLLLRLDGQHTSEEIRAAFTDHFGQPLREEELDEFLQMVRDQGLLQQDASSTPPAASAPAAPAFLPLPPGLQRFLFWRKKIFDPDGLFTWLEPRVRFFWTIPFFVVSSGCILLATGLLWADGAHLVESFHGALRWETAVGAWLVLALMTTLHEFAHGLTCKHHGGEVHEIGFLLLFFMPCFYCNVSDAWLFKEKSRRLWVMFAGGYFELFLWALAVFAWRLSLPGTMPHYLSFLVLSACGVQTLFNFNPLLKLDGYYLLSDWLEVPNLYQRSWEYLRENARWLLWGARPPRPEPQGRVLLLYGLVGWLYSLVFLVLSLVALPQLLGPGWGWLGMAAAAVLGFISVRGICYGFFDGEVTTMVLRRHARTAAWMLALGGLTAALFLIPIEDRVSGSFQVRPAARAELRAPVAGFIQRVLVDEGDRVSAGAEVVRLDVPDLGSRLARKQAEVREVQARLRLLKAGARYEEIVEQRRRVERAATWRDLGRQEQARIERALREDLIRLDKLIIKTDAELRSAHENLDRCRKLRSVQAISEAECAEAHTKCEIQLAQKEQTQAEKRAREALGNQRAESEVARRDKELADARSILTLLEAGTRPEEIEAVTAHLGRLQEEARYLEGQQSRLPVASPVAGVMTTPRLKEKVGQYVKEGDLIGVVEEPLVLDVEITLAEQDVARVQVGQAVALKARALPFETFRTSVDRIAPAAGKGEVQSSVTIYCRLENHRANLRPGMSGHARIATGSRSTGMILVDRALRYLRTEFWW